ncbi:hypothetical protein PSPO01_16058 [Paraphaeosphaeria sporulosa]
MIKSAILSNIHGESEPLNSAAFVASQKRPLCVATSARDQHGFSRVATIFRFDLSDRLDPALATITEFEYLASYSWLESDVPTILVPGYPPLWSPPAGPLKLEPDSGRVYIDQNAARIPDAPLEPLFGALSAQNPDFKMGSVDVITDRNNIRKLLRFLDGTSSESFQIQAEILDGKRALLTRMENETATVIQGFQGYGRNFERACTTGATGTSGYYRFTSFRFGGLQYLLLETLQLAPASTHTSAITVKSEGKVVNCSSILEIKTPAAGKNLDMNEIAAQLWVSQTPHLANVRDWERSNYKVLCSLGYLLNQVIEVVKGSASQVAVLKYDDGMKLEVIAGEQKKAPPEGVDARWQGGKQGSEDDNVVTKRGDQYKIPRFASLVLNSGSNSSQSKARDAAFKLVYSALQDTFQSNDKHKNTIFNALLFVVSHPGTFKWMRNAVRAVYEGRFMISAKQRANLDRWQLDFSAQADNQEDDETTEEEDLEWYNSDDSACFLVEQQKLEIPHPTKNLHYSVSRQFRRIPRGEGANASTAPPRSVSGGDNGAPQRLRAP